MSKQVLRKRTCSICGKPAEVRAVGRHKGYCKAKWYCWSCSTKVLNQGSPEYHHECPHCHVMSGVN